jgi:hypothetical protein
MNIFKAVGTRLDSVTATTFIRTADKGVMVALGLCILVVYILDAIFFGSHADQWWLVPVFVLFGIGLRTLAIWAAVMLQAMRGKKGIGLARTSWRLLWWGTVIACAFSAVSFFAAGHASKERAAGIIGQVEGVAVDSQASKIERLTKEKAADRENTKERIAAARRSMDLVLDDGNSKNDDVSQYEKNIAQYIVDSEARQKDLDAQIAAAENTTETARTDAKVKEAETPSTWAVFSFAAKRTGTSEQDWSDFGLLFFALLLEAIVAFGPGAYYDLHRHFVGMVRRLIAQEAEEAAIMDEEIAESEARVAASRAKAKALRDAAEKPDTADKPETKDPLVEEKVVVVVKEEPLTTEQQRARKGGQASQHKRRAEKNQKKIPVTDDRNEDEMFFDDGDDYEDEPEVKEEIKEKEVA